MAAYDTDDNMASVRVAMWDNNFLWMVQELGVEVVTAGGEENR